MSMFKTTSDINHLINNRYIHQIWVKEGIFTLKIKGYTSLGIIKETLNLSDIKAIKPQIDRAPDKENPMCSEFVMKDKSTAYAKAVELVNSYIQYAKFNRDKLNKEAYTYTGIEKMVFAINRYFEPYESKEFVKQLLELVEINENDKLILLQDAPKRKHGGALDNIKSYIKHWGFDIDLPIWVVNSKGVPVLDNISYLKWLEMRGFRTYFINKNDKIIIRVIENKAIEYSKDMILDYLAMTLKDGDITSFKVFVDSVNKTVFFDLLKTLPKIEKIGIENGDNYGYKAYLNGVMRVDAKSFKWFEYNELPFIIWQNEILPRNLDFHNDINKIVESMFAKFFRKAIGAENVHIFGYLCHHHKNSEFLKMVVLTDNRPTDNPGEANGRTGKGIILQALQHFNKCCVLPDFDPGYQFNLEAVNETHGLIVIPDATYEFNFRTLFNTISDDMTIKRKYEKPLYIPKAKSPKVVAATNHKINLNGDSYEDRVVILHTTTFFNRENTPSKYLGGRLFEGDYNEWNEFDIFCLYAMQKWFLTMNFDSVNKAIIKRLSEFVKPKSHVSRIEYDSFMKNIPSNVYNKYLVDNGLKETLITKYTQGNKPSLISWEKIKY